MSKTDKDRPLWVQNAEHGQIDHDHRYGECIVSDDQRDRWNSWRHHSRVCKKRVKITDYCTKADPNIDPRSGWLPRDYRSQTCWTWVCQCPIPADWKREPHACENRARVQCIGHTRIEIDDSIPCACDDKPEPATCVPAWLVGRYYTWGGVPSWYITQVYHRPERARERDSLRNLIREYNAYGELDDGDFVNRQGRNSARWTWW